MAMGPIEILVLGFPGNRFTGEIIPELERLVESDTISIIDGLLVMKDDAGDIAFVEMDEIDANDDAAALAALVTAVQDMISEDDVFELAAELPPGSSAAILVFEHTWSKPFRDALVNAGGLLMADIRVPGLAVEELLAELAEASA